MQGKQTSKKSGPGSIFLAKKIISPEDRTPECVLWAHHIGQTRAGTDGTRPRQQLAKCQLINNQFRWQEPVPDTQSSDSNLLMVKSESRIRAEEEFWKKDHFLLKSQPKSHPTLTTKKCLMNKQTYKNHIAKSRVWLQCNAKFAKGPQNINSISLRKFVTI